MTDRQFPHHRSLTITESFKHDAEMLRQADRLFSSDWIVPQDITEHDLPYTESFLRQAYTNWLWLIPTRVREELGTPALYSYDGVQLYEGSWGSVEENREILNVELVQLSLKSKRIQIDPVGDYAYVSVPIPARESELVLSVLLYRVEKQWTSCGALSIEGWALQLQQGFYREYEQIFIDDLNRSRGHAEFEAKRRDAVCNMIQTIHHHIDVDAVLSQIMLGVKKLLPTATAEVYVTQDLRIDNPRVKVLMFKPWEDSIVKQAFMTGSICYDQREDGCDIALALKGKQGAYGVLKLIFEHDIPESSELQFVQLIVEAAGAAFENAKLHEQANAVIQELSFINDLTTKINQTLHLKEIFDDATEELSKVFQADYCILLQYHDELSRYDLVSQSVKEDHDAFHEPIAFYQHMSIVKEPFIISDAMEQGHGQGDFFENLNLRSVIAAPLVAGGVIKGIVIVGDSEPRFFTYDNFKLLQKLAQHMGLAIANATLHAQVKHLADKDQLTGLFARHYLNQQIDEQQHSTRCGSLIVIDIDFFKQINDTYGHLMGDQILSQVSRIIGSSIREGDIAARWGGEEIAIYFPNLHASNAYKIAERIRMRIEKETEPNITVSSGIAQWGQHDEQISVESLFNRADMALYHAKQMGRNTIHVFTDTE